MAALPPPEVTNTFPIISSTNIVPRIVGSLDLLAALHGARLVAPPAGADQTAEDDHGVDAEDTQKDHAYVTNRLVRGLASGHEAARQGFAGVLSEVIRTLPASAPPAKMMDLVCKLMNPKLAPSGGEGHAQHARDFVFGRVFGMLSVWKSGTVQDATLASRWAVEMASAMRDYPYVREFCTELLIEAAASSELMRVAVVDAVRQDLEAADLASFNADTISLWLGLARCGAPEWTMPKFAKKALLYKKNASALATILIDTTSQHPRIHSVWPRVVQALLIGETQESKLSSDDRLTSFQAVWTAVVENGLFESTHERKYLAFNLWADVAQELASIEAVGGDSIDPAAAMSVTFGQNSMRCLINSIHPIHGQKERRFLTTIASMALTNLVEAAGGRLGKKHKPLKSTVDEPESKGKGDVALAVLNGLEGEHGNWQFDSYTNTRARGSVLRALHPLAGFKYVETLMSTFVSGIPPSSGEPMVPAGVGEVVPAAAEEKEAKARGARRWAADSMLHLAQSARSHSDPAGLALAQRILTFFAAYGFMKRPKHHTQMEGIDAQLQHRVKLDADVISTLTHNAVTLVSEADRKTKAGRKTLTETMWPVLDKLEAGGYRWLEPLDENATTALTLSKRLRADLAKAPMGKLTEVQCEAFVHMLDTASLFLMLEPKKDQKEEESIAHELEQLITTCRTLSRPKLVNKANPAKAVDTAMGLLVETVLEFLARGSAPLRTAVQALFTSILPLVTAGSLKPILEKLVQDVDEADYKSKAVVVQQEQESDSEAEDESSASESEAEPAGEAMDESGSEPEDEAFKETDKALAAFLKDKVEMKQVKKQALARRIALVHFKYRVLDLVDAMSKHFPDNPLILMFPVPLVQTASKALRGGPEMVKLGHRLTKTINMLLISSKVPLGINRDEMHDALDMILKEVGAESKVPLGKTPGMRAHTQLITLSSLYVVRVLVAQTQTDSTPKRSVDDAMLDKTPEEMLAAAREVAYGGLNMARFIGAYGGVLGTFLGKKARRTDASLFIELFRRRSMLSWTLLPSILDALEDDPETTSRSFQRVQGFVVLDELFRHRNHVDWQIFRANLGRICDLFRSTLHSHWSGSVGGTWLKLVLGCVLRFILLCGYDNHVSTVEFARAWEGGGTGKLQEAVQGAVMRRPKQGKALVAIVSRIGEISSKVMRGEPLNPNQKKPDDAEPKQSPAKKAKLDESDDEEEDEEEEEEEEEEVPEQPKSKKIKK